MKKSSLKRLGLNLALLAVVALPGVATAQQFVYNATGDVLACFRKMNPTGGDQGNYELVLNLGSATNLLKVSSGSQITLTNVTYSALTNAFMDTAGSEPVLAEIQWSATASVPLQPGSGRGNNVPWVTPLGAFPANTLWFTLPATAINVQTAPPSRFGFAVAGNYQVGMAEIGSGAISISGFLGASNANNNAYLVREPDIAYNTYDLTAFIGDAANNSLGDFGSSGTSAMPSGVVENKTPNPFTSAQRDDFYMLCPTGTTNPITGSTNDSYFVGYFILNPNGTMTFTRAATNSVTPPAVVSVIGTITNGFAPLKVVFTNTATGTITNWVWNFGDGTIITNTTGGNVTNTYTAGGNYTVSLTVFGPSGASTNIMASYIVASPTPKLAGPTLSGGKLVFSGSNCPAGVQYRILNSTNVAMPLANWTSVATNTFLNDGTFAWTNSTANAADYFRLVSP